MRKINYIFTLIYISLTLSCEKLEVNPEIKYIEKANEIIIQTAKDNDCDCLLEIPNKSMIEISSIENPEIDFRSILIKKLKLKNNSSLDSLISISKNFEIDSQMLKKNNLKIVSMEYLQNMRDNPKIFENCPKGIICFRKPIFDKEFKRVVLDYGIAFVCIKRPFSTYKFENEKWLIEE